MRRLINSPAVAAHVFGAVVALSVGYFVVGIPIQLTDSLANLMSVQSPLGLGTFNPSGGYLRPFLLGQLRVAVMFAHGHYFLTFKAIHVVQLVACAVLLVRLVKPVTWPRAAAAGLGVAALFGGHTFTGTITEAFPINTFLTIVLCSLLAANLSFSAPAWWKDVSIAALFVFSILTVESGVLVLVVAVAARMAGARGISRAGVWALCLLLGGYLILRFGGGNIAGPALSERPSGFGFSRLEPQDLQSRFGDRPWVFYAYNVVCQLLTVLFSEPRGGFWEFAYSATHDKLLPHHGIAVAVTTGATLLIVGFVASRIARWRRWALQYDDQLVAVFAAVLAGNAVVSYPYTKDVIVSVAGAFFAVATAVAAAHVLGSLEVRTPFRAIVIATLLTALAAGWSVRVIGAQWNLRRYAFVVRNEWLDLDDWAVRNHMTMTPAAWQLARTLQQDALARQVPPPFFINPRAERYLAP